MKPNKIELDSTIIKQLNAEDWAVDENSEFKNG